MIHGIDSLSERRVPVSWTAAAHDEPLGQSPWRIHRLNMRPALGKSMSTDLRTTGAYPMTRASTHAATPNPHGPVLADLRNTVSDSEPIEKPTRIDPLNSNNQFTSHQLRKRPDRHHRDYRCCRICNSHTCSCRRSSSGAPEKHSTRFLPKACDQLPTSLTRAKPLP